VQGTVIVVDDPAVGISHADQPAVIGAAGHFGVANQETTPDPGRSSFPEASVKTVASPLCAPQSYASPKDLKFSRSQK
jgi:hypothetical protein